MSKSKHDDDEPKSKQTSEPETKAEPEVPAAHLTPYPTGNPPDPMEQHYKYYPERKPTEPEADEAPAKKRK